MDFDPVQPDQAPTSAPTASFEPIQADAPPPFPGAGAGQFDPVTATAAQIPEYVQNVQSVLPPAQEAQARQIGEQSPFISQVLASAHTPTDPYSLAIQQAIRSAAQEKAPLVTTAPQQINGQPTVDMYGHPLAPGQDPRVKFIAQPQDVPSPSVLMAQQRQIEANLPPGVAPDQYPQWRAVSQQLARSMENSNTQMALTGLMMVPGGNAVGAAEKVVPVINRAAEGYFSPGIAGGAEPGALSYATKLAEAGKHAINAVVHAHLSPFNPMAYVEAYNAASKLGAPGAAFAQKVMNAGPTIAGRATQLGGQELENAERYGYAPASNP